MKEINNNEMTIDLNDVVKWLKIIKKNAKDTLKKSYIKNAILKTEGNISEADISYLAHETKSTITFVKETIDTLLGGNNERLS